MALATSKSAVVEAREKIEAILAGRRNSEKHVAEVLEADTAALQKAEEDVQKAVTSNDLDAYQKAKKELQTAKDSKELHTAWAETVKRTPAITSEEYDSLVSAIYAELDALEDATMQIVVKLADEMAAAGEQLKAAQNEANTVLEKLQHDIYKDADRRHSKDGRVISATDAKIITKWDTINYAVSPTQHYRYNEYKNRRPQQ